MNQIKIYWEEYRSSKFIKKIGHLISYQTVSLVALVGAFTVGSTEQKIHNGIIAFLFVLTIHLLFFLLNIIFRYNPNRETRVHGSLIIELEEIYSKIEAIRKGYYQIDLEKQSQTVPDTDLMNILKEREEKIDYATLFVLEDVCNLLKNHFDRKTNSKCCVSIKVIKDLNVTIRDASVYNECRNKSHVKERDTSDYKKKEHTIDGNSGFNTISKLVNNDSIDREFIHPNLNSDPYYLNTSKSLYPNEELPYKSEIIVPLIPFKDSNPALIGFLCVDSNRKDKFGKKYDIPVLKMISGSLYDIILRKTFK